MKQTTLFFFILIPLFVFSQPKSDAMRDAVWPFASEIESSSNQYLGCKFNFKNDSFNLQKDTFPIGLNACASICDENGDLLFYSNGCSIYGANDNLIINGDSLNSGYLRNEHCPYGINIPQGVVILPVGKEKFWMVYQRKSLVQDEVIYDRVYYSIIEKNENDLFEVVLKDKILLDNVDLLGGNIATCRHGNGRDWWLVMSEANSNKKYKILIDAHYKFAISQQSIGNQVLRKESATGNSKISPNGKKLAIFNSLSGLHVFDFDRCTGELNFYKHSALSINESEGIAGLAFSPNSYNIYLVQSRFIYQFEIWAWNFSSTKKIIAEFDERKDILGLSKGFYQAQRGPDGKIYIGSPGNSGVWHVIENPNGYSRVNFVQNKYEFLNSIYSGALPHFPNFRLGPDKWSYCDSLNIPSRLTIESQPSDVTVCESNVCFEVTAFGDRLYYQWQVMRENQWEDLRNDTSHNGITSPCLSIAPATKSMNNQKYRCIIWDDDERIESRIATLTVKDGSFSHAYFEYEINEDTVFIENKSRTQSYADWFFGDGTKLDSVKNPGYHVYKPTSYDSTYWLAMWTQSECGDSWRTSEIKIEIPKFEIDFEIVENNSCENPPRMKIKELSNNGHRIKNRKWLNKTDTSFIITNIDRYNIDSTEVYFEYPSNGAVYHHTFIACDEFRCDTITKDSFVIIYDSINLNPQASHIEDRIFDFYLLGEHNADSILWTFENGELLGKGENIQYEFQKDSTYTIFITAIHPCETAYDTLSVTVSGVVSSLDLIDESNISIFPNPSKGDLIIQNDGIIENETRFKFFDTNGRLLLKNQLSKDLKQIPIDLSRFPPGLYFYRIETESGLSIKEGKLLLKKE